MHRRRLTGVEGEPIHQQFTSAAISWGRKSIESLGDLGLESWILHAQVPASDPRIDSILRAVGFDPREFEVHVDPVAGDTRGMAVPAVNFADAHVVLGDRKLRSLVSQLVEGQPLVWVPTGLRHIERMPGQEVVILDPELFSNTEEGVDPEVVFRVLVQLLDATLAPAAASSSLALASHAWRELWNDRSWMSVPSPDQVPAERFLDVAVLSALAAPARQEGIGLRRALRDLMAQPRGVGFATHVVPALLRRRLDIPETAERITRMATWNGFCGPAAFVLAVEDSCETIRNWWNEVADSVPRGETSEWPVIDSEAVIDPAGALSSSEWDELICGVRPPLAS